MSELQDNEKFMREAINEAIIGKSDGEFPFSAIIVHNGRIMSRAHSQEMKTANIINHSELRAINDACEILKKRDLNDCAIYCNVEPCTMCSSAILQARIPKIIIGAERKDLPAIMRPRRIGIMQLIDDSAYRPEIKFGVLKEEALKLFLDIKRNSILSPPERIK